MNKMTTTKIAVLTVFSLFTLNSANLSAQTWGAYSEVAQYWPNNDVKSHGGNLYVASNDGFFKSTDNGVTWSNLTAGANVGADFVEIQFTTSNGIFLRQNSNGVVSSLDGGNTWIVDTTGVGGNYGSDMLYWDETSDRVFFGVGWPSYGLYYKGTTDPAWTKIPAGSLPAGLNNFSPVQMTRKNDKLFIIDIYNRILESSDDGLTWIQKTGTGMTGAGSQVGPGRFIAIGNDLYAGFVGVRKSSDDGNTWVNIDTGFELTSGIYVDTRCLYYDGTTLYATVQASRKAYKSTDLGTTWDEFGGSGEWWFKALAMHNGSLFGVIHSKDSIYVFGGSASLSESSEENTFEMYPNPADDHVTISSLPAGAVVRITDMTGEILSENVSPLFSYTLDITNLSPGSYLILIESEGVRESRKLLIQH